MTITVDLDEARTHLSRLLDQVAAGVRVIITRAGEPLAELVPHQRKKVVFGGLKGQVRYGDDIVGTDPEVNAMFSDDLLDDDAPAR